MSDANRSKSQYSTRGGGADPDPRILKLDRFNFAKFLTAKNVFINSKRKANLRKQNKINMIQSIFPRVCFLSKLSLTYEDYFSPFI